MRIFLMMFMIFFAPFFAVVAIVDEVIYIDAGKFLSFLNSAKTENQKNIISCSNEEEYGRFMFHVGKDVAYADVMDYFMDD